MYIEQSGLSGHSGGAIDSVLFVLHKTWADICTATENVLYLKLATVPPAS